MKPIFSKYSAYEDFLDKNKWVYEIFPNARLPLSSPWLVPRSPKDEVGKRGSRARMDSRSESGMTKGRFGMMFVGNFIESILKKVQKSIINRHKTTELITDTQLWFFPDDFEKNLPIFARKRYNTKALKI